jgi:hypothetical protein
LLVPLLAFAAPGEVDPGFGTAGRLAFPPGFGGLAALPDGRLQMVAVDAGSVRVLRLDHNARPDAISGSAPMIESPIAPVTAVVQRALVAGDGRSYLAVSVDQGVASIPISGGYELVQRNEARLLRLLADGRPDPGFGPDGMRAFPAARVSGANSSAIIDVAVAANGASYVLVDYFYQAYDTDFGLRLFRLRPDGELDATFANGGELTLPGEYKYWQPWAIALVQEDKVLLQGSTGQAMLIGSTGRAEFVPEAWRSALQGAESVAVVSTGASVFLAVARSAGGVVLDVSRWHPDFTLDPTFGDAGSGHSMIRLDREISLVEFGRIRLLAGGGGSQLFVATVVRTPLSNGTLIHRLGADGTLDPSSVGDGVAADNAWFTPEIRQDGSVIVTTGQRTALRLVWGPADSPGLVAMPLACNVDNHRPRSSEPLRVSLTRSLGSAGSIEIRYRTQLVRSNPDPAQKVVEGTLTWGDGVTGARSFEVPGVLDAFDVVLEAVSGQPVIDCTRARIQTDVPSPPQVTPPAPQAGGTSGAVESGGGATDLVLLTFLSLLLAAKARWRDPYSRSRSR